MLLVADVVSRFPYVGVDEHMNGSTSDIWWSSLWLHWWQPYLGMGLANEFCKICHRSLKGLEHRSLKPRAAACFSVLPIVCFVFPTGKKRRFTNSILTAYPNSNQDRMCKSMNPWRLTSPRWAWGTTNSSFSWWCMAAFAPSLGVSRRSLCVASSCLKLRPFSEENDQTLGFYWCSEFWD